MQWTMLKFRIVKFNRVITGQSLSQVDTKLYRLVGHVSRLYKASLLPQSKHSTRWRHTDLSKVQKREETETQVISDAFSSSVLSITATWGRLYMGTLNKYENFPARIVDNE